MRRLSIPLLFFLSGAAGLVYQVVWMRKLSLVLGATSAAVSTVLAVFMGGLALGSWALGRAGDETRSPLVLYGWMELGIALLGAQSLLLLDGMLANARELSDWAGPAMPAVRVLLAALVLLGPTTLMGATLPVLLRGARPGADGVGRASGVLYGINTLGAFAGVVASAFFLVPGLGLRRTTLVAAGLNALVGVLALALGRRDRASAPAFDLGPTPPERTYTTKTGRAVLLAFGAAGFLALAYEVLWTRYLIFVVGENSVYAFATMLSAFLLGIALGSLLAAAIVDRVRDRVALLGGVLVLIGASAALTVVLMEPLARSTRLDAGGVSFWADSARRFAKCVAVLLVPTTLSGTTFAIVARIYARDERTLGRDAGRAYAVNTLGAIAGAAAAGFVILPLLGLVGGILVCAALQVACGLALCLRRRPEGRAVRTAVATGAVAGVALVVGAVARSPVRALHHDVDGFEVVFWEDGPESTVAVLEDPQSGHRYIEVDGEGQAGTDPLIQLHLRLLGHLPALFHPDARTGLVIAFGAGVTTGCLAQHPLDRVELVELSRAVLRAAPYFADWNHDPLGTGSKVQVHVDDGRNFLLGTDRTWDIITTDPIDADDAGTTSLYCREYFELVRDHLDEGGLACHWITPEYGREGFPLLLRTFQSVFPYTSVWHAGVTTVVVGSVTPPRVDLDRLREEIAYPPVQESLDFVGVDSAETLLSLLLLGPDEVRALAGVEGPGFPLNTDDRPRVEYLRHGMRSAGAEPWGAWLDVLEHAPADPAGWVARWSDADELDAMRERQWIEESLALTRIEVAEAAGELEGEALLEADLRWLRGYWSIVSGASTPVVRLTHGLPVFEPAGTFARSERQRYGAGLELAFRALDEGRLDAARDTLRTLADELGGTATPELLLVWLEDSRDEPAAALAELCDADRNWMDPWVVERVARALVARVLHEMEARPQRAEELGARLDVLLPKRPDRPRSTLTDAPRPDASTAGSAALWRAWWLDARAHVAPGVGRMEWSANER